MGKGKFHKWLESESLVLIEGWARDGLTEEQIAFNMGVNRSTLTDWKKRFPAFSDALKNGKEVVDFQVENALVKSALGYMTEEETIERVWNEEKGVFEDQVTKRVRKFQPPNVTAQIFWLKNRRPDKWRDQRNIEHGGQITNNNVDLTGLSAEELRKLANLDDKAT